jgi:type VII secretion protein EccB
VLNYTSARLIIGSEPKMVRVSRNSLRDVPHGLPVGIESAPDYLPDLGRLDGRHWHVCSSIKNDATGTGHSFVTLWVGARSTGRPLDADTALLVRTPAGQTYLAWNNRRLKVPTAATLGALGYAAVPQYPVGYAWLNALPAGADLSPPDVPDRGRDGPTIGALRTVAGQLVKADSPAGSESSQYFVVRTDGLSPLTPVAAALLLSDARTAGAYRGGPVGFVGLDPAALAAAPRSGEVSINPNLPAKAPKPAELSAGEVPCIQLSLDAKTGLGVQVGLGAAPASGSSAVATAAGDRMLADQVVVQPGAGLLMRDLPAPGVADGTLYLLVDTGVRYPIPSQDAAKALGYDQVAPTPVPAVLLGLVPAGRPLDPQAARATLGVSTGTG